jgi:hypothetical protein
MESVGEKPLHVNTAPQRGLSSRLCPGHPGHAALTGPIDRMAARTSSKLEFSDEPEAATIVQRQPATAR